MDEIKNRINRNIKISLAAKYIIGLILIVLVITGLVIGIGIYSFYDSTCEHYDTVGYHTAHAAASYFSEKQIKEYADALERYKDGAISQGELDAVTLDDKYQDTYDKISKLRTNMEANDIYIGIIDMDIYNSYTEEKDAAKEWKPLFYIMESYYNEDEEYSFGNSSRLNPKYRKVITESYTSGKRTRTQLVSQYKSDFTLTAFYPIVYDGKTVAAIGVETPMTSLNSDIMDFVVKVLIFDGILMLFMILIGSLIIVKTVVKPIKTIAEEAQRFIGDNTEVSDSLDNIKTGDEIQALSQSLLKMEIDTKEYIENIKNITAEKERIGAELNVATQIQADMLPRIFPPFPEHHEFDIYASMNPAKEVGGDFYDFFLIDDDHIGLVMADVSGKGVPAALFMVIAKTLIKNRTSLSKRLSPSDILMDVNTQLCEGNEAELFVTVWLAILNIKTGKGRAANAGHEHPAVKRAGGDFELVMYRHSPAVATMDGIRFRDHDFELNPGDALFVYTDGVTEATNSENVLFGNDRLVESLNREKNVSAEKLLKNVKEDIDKFVGDAPQFDDITMLGFTYFGADGNDKDA